MCRIIETDAYLDAASWSAKFGGDVTKNGKTASSYMKQKPVPIYSTDPQNTLWRCSIY